MNHPKKIWLLLTLLFCYGQGRAQDSSARRYIRDILVSGNRTVKTKIILREIQFKAGDSLPALTLVKELEQARRQVYNLSLFNEVRVSATAVSEKAVDVLVTVKERWHIYPVPQFQWVDRNFNEWWKTYHHSFDRVNYGIKFAHYNLTGRRDQLRVYFINGYSRNYILSYSNPYFNKKLNRGISFYATYFQNREVSYRSSYDNVLQFFPVTASNSVKVTGDFIRHGFSIGGGYSIRKGLFTRQSVSINYTYASVADSLLTAKYNRNYFGQREAVSHKGYFDLAYSFSYSKLNNNSYPLSGLAAYAAVVKRGWGLSEGMEMLSVEGGVDKYFDLKKNWYANVQAYAKVKVPFVTAYLNQRGLGYGEVFLRGLEYKVIDGVAYGLVKSTLKKKLYSFSIPFPFFPRILTKIPFTFFAKAYADAGYVYTRKRYDTYLSNRLLYSGGIGIDILTLYDVNFRFEYSLNQLGGRGLFFHTQNGF